ncbi:MAG: glycerol-3-phosphate 1-O-acyltransferase PlsY [Candidatus Midichloria sp.]|uniref:Glycerol-3-phosphate 1-O-acyltransferase PlsY n=1 Tax=Hyalomma marginatum TaxID=34627 RepID=A0A8S4C2H3_9ACAR|nr:glycerol-3-phosphate 1-O-acyltransferase PlsY [Hyalomma marginatum]CAG7593181.1 glycerol-3-phosphate 1-O-acyltransferase PlsY [Hyalomma marginatum]
MQHLFSLGIVNFILIALISYFCGSIPFGLLVSKSFGTTDLRTRGSGNIGATNAWRVGGKKIGLLTFFFDTMKSFLPVLVFKYLFGTGLAALAGLFVIIGHMFPVWLSFKGGKGVASMFGLLFAATPQTAIISALIWLVTFKKFRVSAIASLIAISINSIVSFFILDLLTAVVYLFLLLLIISRHMDNINRLRNNKESKL